MLHGTIIVKTVQLKNLQCKIDLQIKDNTTMKVTKEKEQFKPITITIENEDEALWLWCALNYASLPIMNKNENYIEGNCKDKFFYISDSMFESFDKVFKPKEIVR